AAMMAATKRAIEVPLRVMEVSLEAMETIRTMADIGQETSASDAGVAALCARSAVRGAYLNVRINVADLSDLAAATDFLDRGAEIQKRAKDMEQEILALVERNI
ncbi:MAG: cyclodeaminase/cyclohydrolase family protein, partial [Acidimicrobiia bacterium]